ncbi:hypothetical protein FVER53263_08090 [Fusarium verticillioides]|nr:hypothetical protein FVER53263_08090 [Fusarium verticillioides]
MALEPGSGRRSVSPESSGRESPIPRQWRNQLGEEDYAIKDKSYRKYAQGVDRALVLFETALEEWADYISFLNKLLKALQARPKSINAIPSKATVAKRLSQCLNPSLPSGVHQKALELYNLVFSVIGKDGLSRDLPLYLPGLATVLSFASLSVRAPYLDLLERHFLGIDPRSLRPAMKSIILALLPGLEEETSEDFDRTLRLVESFKHAIRPSNSEEITNQHSSGDAFFWQCFFLASITSQSRRSGALAYLVRSLPPLRPRAAPDPNKSATSQSDSDEDTKSKLAELVTSPEPGLLLRCFASGLSDEQLLIQRGFLDLLVSHLPLNAHVIQSRVKPDDLELLLKAAVGVVTRRDMSLNRRLWAWLLGPEPAAEHEANGDNPSSPPADQHAFLASKTDYFEEFGLQPLTKAILQMIESNSHNTASERAKPYRICLSLMDRWEIGGLVVPEVFLPIIESVRRFKDITSSKTEFSEVLRSASVFFDGIESGLIYGEIASLLAQALGPGALSPPDRNDKLSLVNFILSNFNVREEEMITLHAPLCCLTALAMLQDFKERVSAKNHLDPQMLSLSTQALSVATSLLELVPERVFPVISKDSENQSRSLPTNVEILKSSQSFYVNEQGNIEASASPFDALTMGRAILEKAAQFVCQDLESSETDLNACIRLLVLVIHKTPRTYEAKEEELLQLMLELLEHPDIMAFSSFLAILQLLTQLYYAERIETAQLSSLVPLLVRHAWTYLSASEPKYHVEAVRGLWQLQSALSTSNRDIEAALSSLIISQETARLGAIQAVDKGRALSVLWSHTLQDNVSHERRGSKTPTQDMKNLPRLAGADNYEIILTQPVFLILDALQDDRTPLYMTVKAWLNTMLGIDREIGITFANLRETFSSNALSLGSEKSSPESTLIFLLNGLEQVLARAHQQLLNEEARTQVVKTPDQPQSLFGSMVSNVWQSDTPQSRSATANDRLTVHLAFQDAVRICFKIWTWGQGNDSSKQDQGSFGSFNYTSLRMRNRARRLLEHLFAAENLQCLETVIALWKQPIDGAESTQVFNMLSALEACRPKHCIPALFNAIYRRTGAGAGAVDTASKSTMTISLQDTDLVWFLVEYTRTLDDDAMDEIWQDCMAFLKDLLTNPFPHRQTLPNLLGFAALLGEKVDNTNFGEQRRMRKELGDTFIRLLAALFTTRPVAFTDSTTSGSGIPKSDSGNSLSGASEGPDDIISILASIVPKLAKVLVEPDRVLSATATISTNVIGPTLRAKGFPDIVSKNTMCLLHELSRVHNNQKNWKKDVGDAFNDSKFFGMDLDLAKEHWLPLLRQWTLTDKEKMPEIVGRINAPSTAGIVFGVGATSARLEADRKTQLNLRRIATLILAGSEDAFVSDLSEIFSRLAELLGASSTSSPSSTTRADIYMVFRALALRTSAIHLGMLWPVVNAEIHAAISSVAAPDNSTASDTYTNASVLQACKLLDLLICVAPDDFQLHEWLFITDTIDAVYRPSTYQPVALVDELSDELGASVSSSGFQSSSVVNPVARGSSRRPLLGPGGINDDVSLDRKDELVAKVLRPFFGQLSIFAFESTYAMGRVDRDACISSLLKDIFDERSIVRAL